MRHVRNHYRSFKEVAEKIGGRGLAHLGHPQMETLGHHCRHWPDLRLASAFICDRRLKSPDEIRSSFCIPPLCHGREQTPIENSGVNSLRRNGTSSRLRPLRRNSPVHRYKHWRAPYSRSKYIFPSNCIFFRTCRYLGYHEMRII